MGAVNIVQIGIVIFITVAIILPIQQFKTRCNNIETQFLTDKVSHKENVASLHDQCQKQLDSHLSEKQESFQRQIDRLKEQYQSKLEEEHQKTLNSASEIFKYKTTGELHKNKISRMEYQISNHENYVKNLKNDHSDTLKKVEIEHEAVLDRVKDEVAERIRMLESKIKVLQGKLHSAQMSHRSTEIEDDYEELREAQMEKDIEEGIEEALADEGDKEIHSEEFDDFSNRLKIINDGVDKEKWDEKRHKRTSRTLDQIYQHKAAKKAKIQKEKDDEFNDFNNRHFDVDLDGQKEWDERRHKRAMRYAKRAEHH